MTRRVLIGTIGATPQVVTETVWRLMRRSPPWIPDEIEIVTTTFALPRIFAALQAPGGPLAKLFPSGAAPTTILLPRGDGQVDVFPAGGPNPQPSPHALRDVNTQQDAALMGDLILRRVARVTADLEAELHVSLAGGRKTMSAHALLAFTLMARLQDEASHVLVNPTAFEDHVDFWHPDQGGLIHKKEDLHKTPRPPPSLDPKTAEVTLVSTPAPLMRSRAKHVAELETLSLVETIKLANLAVALKTAPALTVDTRRNEIQLCGTRARLGPKLFALMRLMAEARRGLWSAPDNAELCGWYTTEQLVTGAAPNGVALIACFTGYLKQAIREAGGDPDDPEDRILERWRAAIAWPRVPQRLEAIENQLRPNIKNLRTTLQDRFGADASKILFPGLRKRAGGAPFGLGVPREAITII